MSNALAEPVVIFALHGRAFGLPLSAVERVVQMVGVAPLPEKSSEVRGVIRVRGEIVPVIDLRVRLGLGEAPLRATDELVICRAHRRRLALVAEEVTAVVEPHEFKMLPAEHPGDGLITARTSLVSGGEVGFIRDVERLVASDVQLAIVDVATHA